MTRVAALLCAALAACLDAGPVPEAAPPDARVDVGVVRACTEVCPDQQLRDEGDADRCADGTPCALEPACAVLQTRYRGAVVCPPGSNNCAYDPGKGRVPCLGQQGGEP